MGEMKRATGREEQERRSQERFASHRRDSGSNNRRRATGSGRHQLTFATGLRSGRG